MIKKWTLRKSVRGTMSSAMPGSLRGRRLRFECDNEGDQKYDKSGKFEKTHHITSFLWRAQGYDSVLCQKMQGFFRKNWSGLPFCRSLRKIKAADFYSQAANSFWIKFCRYPICGLHKRSGYKFCRYPICGLHKRSGYKLGSISRAWFIFLS